jgi:hypothetical protein
LAAGLPPNPGRFAPLVGMLLDECSGAAHAIDFLHPRQRPKPQSRRRLLAIAAGGVAAALVLSAGLGYYRYWSLGQETAAAQAKSKSLEKHEQVANEVIDKVRKIEDWAQGDVVWLNELRYLSANFPPPEQIIVKQFDAAADGRDGVGGRSMLDCIAMNSQLASQVEEALRDQRHKVQTVQGVANDPRQTSYSWLFKKVVSVDPPTEDELAAALAPPPAAADPPPDEESAASLGDAQPASAAQTGGEAAEGNAAPSNSGRFDRRFRTGGGR